MKNVVKKRGVEGVLHFTRLSNLESILDEGLVSRQELEGREDPPAFNDADRFDRQKDAICFSIGHPNYKMFYSLRKQNPDEKWVVLAVKPDILWLKDCAFCVENAASNAVTNIPIQDRKGLAAFNSMFDEIEGKPKRAELKIKKSTPTNPQAEILIFEPIEPEFILCTCCDSKKLVTNLKDKFKDFEFLLKPAAFSARKDYRHWKS